MTPLTREDRDGVALRHIHRPPVNAIDVAMTGEFRPLLSALETAPGERLVERAVVQALAAVRHIVETESDPMLKSFT